MNDKKCPHCGCSLNDGIPLHSWTIGGVQTRCNCGAHGPLRKTVEDADDAYNTRPIEDAQQKRIEELEGLLNEVLDNEWMVSPDWSGSQKRNVFIDKIREALEVKQ